MTALYPIFQLSEPVTDIHTDSVANPEWKLQIIDSLNNSFNG